MNTSTTLTHRDGQLLIEELPDDRRLITVMLTNPKQFMLRGQWRTRYTVPLIQEVLGVTGPAFLCDEISRDEDPDYVQKRLIADLLAFFDKSEFAGKRLLDFGCGSGASTVVLARALPDTEIVGVELREDLLSVARARVRFYGLPRVTLQLSPNGAQLPPGLGDFDFVILSGVYEHLLPEERSALLPQLWAVIRDGGSLFFDQIPNRLFPIELHTTRLPLLNYVPAPLALAAARQFSRRVRPHESWNDLLRRGIRGATVREIVRHLPGGKDGAVVREPSKLGRGRDRIDLWYQTTGARLPAIKSAARATMKVLRQTTGLCLTPDVTTAITKRHTGRPERDLQ